MNRTRQDVITVRDAVREQRRQGMTFEQIAESMKFECGIAEAVAYDLDLILSEDDSELDGLLAQAILENPKVVTDYKSGKKSAIGSLIGFVKKKHPHLDAKKVQETLIKMLP